MEVNYIKLVWWLIKYRIRYPRFRKKSMHISEPNLTSGLTDHPLDKNATPLYDIFTASRKFFARNPISILRVKLKNRRKNSFIFSAWGYDILHKRDMSELCLEYLTDAGVKFTDCILQIDILTPHTYRLRLAMGKEIPRHETPMVYADITDEGFETKLEELPDRYIISTPSIKIHVFRENFKIKIYDTSDSLITKSGGRTENDFPNATDAFPLGFVKNRKPRKVYAVENFNLYPGESIFGLGEKFGAMNRVGQTVSLWHLDGQGNTTARAYKHVPFFLSSRGYGVYFNDFNPMTFWVGTREVSKVAVAIENNIIDYFFFYGPTPKKILAAYTSLTGRSHLPPRWSFGTWMSRLSYASEDEVLEVARRLRSEKYPCDVINIDTNWCTREWACDWQFDEKRFPDPERMFRECSELGFKISLWQIPYVMDSLPIRREGKRKRVFAKNRGPFMFIVIGPAHVIDFSRIEGVRWYQEKLMNLFKLGAKVIKVDFGEQIEPHQKFAGYSGREMHNLYPLLYNKAAFEATEEFFGEGQAVIWARSAYAGSQRYPLHWSGDNSSNFANMLTSLRGGLSLGLCGFTFWSQDVGGFVGIPSDKLYIRWTALSIFQSHIRFHGCPPKFREPWNFTLETQSIVRKLLEFRYRLVPYLFSESIKASREGLPLMRPLLLEFPGDPTCYNIEDQFFSGEILMIAPILTEQDFRRVYIPEGEWYNYWTGDIVRGPQWVEIESALDQIPLYVRSGVFLPLGEVVQYIPEELPGKLTLLAFPGSEGKLRYELHDELGSIRFSGKLKDSTLSVEVSYIPEDREKLEIEILLPKGHESVQIEIEHNLND